MTPRQIHELAKVIHRRAICEMYLDWTVHAAFAGIEKFPPLSTFLGVGSEVGPDRKFDEETDKKLEAAALKRIEQMRKKSDG